MRKWRIFHAIWSSILHKILSSYFFPLILLKDCYQSSFNHWSSFYCGNFSSDVPRWNVLIITFVIAAAIKIDCHLLTRKWFSLHSILALFPMQFNLYESFLTLFASSHFFSLWRLLISFQVLKHHKNRGFALCSSKKVGP